MSAPDGTPSTFREALLALLAEQELSIRKLAGLLAAIDGRSVESHRRAVHKYVQVEGPTVPEDAAVAKIVAALGVRDDYFASALASSRQVDLPRRAELEARVSGVEGALAGLRAQLESLQQDVRDLAAHPHTSGGES